MNSKPTAFLNPETQNALVKVGDKLLDSKDGTEVALIVNGIPRFVKQKENYAQSFGFQWNHWHSVLSQSRSNYDHARDLKIRSGLWDGAYQTKGARLLECGMGGGDDTEVLLTLPIAELHAFDLSIAVDRAASYLKDERLTLSQASIYSIPYPRESFDIVWCHRVIQHTPEPDKAMRCVCRMVKPGGFLFIHSYKRSVRYMREFRYVYRPLTTRIPRQWVLHFVNTFGAILHHLNRAMALTALSREIAYRFVPFYSGTNAHVSQMARAELIEWQKMITFDALTPLYDAPMTTEHFTSILKEEGFEIRWLYDPDVSPLLARAVKK